MSQDENNGQGGSYVIQDGVRVLVERTLDNPEGNGPRPAEEAPASTPDSAQATAAEQTAAEPPSDPAVRLSAIRDAIANLAKDQTANWMKDGRPNSAALSSVLGWPVAAAERDAAWQTILDSQTANGGNQ